MEPAFGWTQLSPQDLRRVETELAEQGLGVRDELGFLELHTLYAERFFPGTTVLLTRLRYCLFVPWIYADAARGEQRNIRQFVEKRQEVLTCRLMRGDESGIIGSRTYPALPAEPPASLYWNALGRWGIVRPVAPGVSSFPSQGEVERFLGRTGTTSRLQDDDRRSLEAPAHRVFAELPEPPAVWGDDEAPLTFRLNDDERDYMRAILASVRRSDGERSLLARLAAGGVTLGAEDVLWQENIIHVADDADAGALQRAAVVATLGMIGRALYAAMVETLREERDGVPTSDVHRTRLDSLSARLGPEIAEFDVTAILADGHVSDEALHLLRLVQQYCAEPSDLLRLHSALAEIELRRKGSHRARLPDTIDGRGRRLEWTPGDHTAAEPLHYRWPTVRRLLRDLEGA